MKVCTQMSYNQLTILYRMYVRLGLTCQLMEEAFSYENALKQPSNIFHIKKVKRNSHSKIGF